MATGGSESTTTTRGGCSYDDLCRGSEAYYACDNSVDISDVQTVGQAKERVVERIEEIMKDLSIQRGKQVKKFYIGKTHVHGQKIRGKGSTREVKPLDPSTWNKGGIGDRWQHNCQFPHGKDGMVVLAMATKDTLSSVKCQDVHQENIAIALEQQLLHHYRIDVGNNKLENKTFEPGKSDHGKSAAYVVYMTFGL